ncbi:MAG: hypothetical protein J6O49_06545 [Bacteroidaceae bacterium]|nr:hypothetical protein [Bacteroidaceae bacterium]
MPFNTEKIVNAVLKAAADVDGEVTDEVMEIANKIAAAIEDKATKATGHIYSVEEIQDKVVEELKASARPDIGKAYAEFRKEHAEARKKSETYAKMVEDKLSERDEKNYELELIKRDGSAVPFNGEKIVKAILKAAADVDKSVTDQTVEIAKTIAAKLTAEAIDVHVNSRKTFTVEEIQDKVVEELKASARPDIGGAYSAYRQMRTKQREEAEKRDRLIKDKLAARNVVNANANMDENSFSGRMAEARNVITKQVALDSMSKIARVNHIMNMIYTHDLDSYEVGMHNCLSIPFDDCLKTGVQVGGTFLRPARSINTAMQLVAVISQLQSQCQFGGVSATHIDWTMVPYVRISFWKHFKDGMKWAEMAEIPVEMLEQKPEDVSIEDTSYKSYEKAYEYAVEMTRKETYQAVEGMFHNLNSLQSRSGGQLPFTSIKYGSCTLPEGRLVTRAILENSLKGTGKLYIVNGVEQGLTPIFPCGIFQLGKGINRKPGDPNYDLFQLALKSTARRLYPNYANLDWSGNVGYDPNDPKTYFSTMGKHCTAHVKPFEPCQGVSA